MSFIQLQGINDVQEPTVVAEGQYDLVIETAKIHKKEGSDKESILVIIGFEGRPDVSPIFHYMGLPNSDDESKSLQFKLLGIKRFCHMFGISCDAGVDLMSFPGSRARCNVGQDTYEGRTKNVIMVADLPRV